MSESGARMLLVGFGNPGRLDDGLGPALAGAVEAMDLPALTVEADYQLTVEDAALAAQYDIVVFADADTAGPEPFHVRRIRGDENECMSFSSHSVRPTGVLALAKKLFNAEPQAYLLGIRGYEFNAFGEGLSAQAQANLAEAITYVKDAVRAGHFREVRSGETRPGQAGQD